MSDKTFRPITDLEIVEQMSDNDTVLIERNGMLKRTKGVSRNAVKSVNGVAPDENGDVQLEIPSIPPSVGIGEAYNFTIVTYKSGSSPHEPAFSFTYQDIMKAFEEQYAAWGDGWSPNKWEYKPMVFQHIWMFGASDDVDMAQCANAVMVVHEDSWDTEHNIKEDHFRIEFGDGTTFAIKKSGGYENWGGIYDSF